MSHLGCSTSVMVLYHVGLFFPPLLRLISNALSKTERQSSGQVAWLYIYTHQVKTMQRTKIARE